jgi:short-subunit dehydrogenase
MRKAIIIGASSGIGMQLAKELSKQGFALGLAARRVELLSALKNNLVCQCSVYGMDITHSTEAASTLNNMICEMDGVDLIVISAGTGHINHDLKWELEEDTIKTNVAGFTAIVGAALTYFMQKGEGHIAAVSSVAALRGGADSPAYYASKAYVSNYLEGIRCKVAKENMNIAITDIRPGLVDTAMAKGEGLFWVMPVEIAGRQIYTAIRKRKAVAYVTKRWGLIAFLLRIMPKWLYSKL